MLRYAISDRHLHPGVESEQQSALVQQAIRLATQGIDFFQLREKDLSTPDFIALANRTASAITQTGAPMRFLLNTSPETAQVTPAHGVHLSSTALAHLQDSSRTPPLKLPTLISVSCHTLAEIELARSFASLILFGPVFEKPLEGKPPLPGTGLAAFAVACRHAAPVPVLALGGITAQNTPACLAAGAAGIAGIRLFCNGSALGRNKPRSR